MVSKISKNDTVWYFLCCNHSAAIFYLIIVLNRESITSRFYMGQC